MTHRVVLGVTARPALSVIVGHVDGLRALGWDVHVVTGEAIDTRMLPGVRCHHIQLRREPAALADVRAWKQWRALLAQLQPDVVVGATPKASLMALTAAWSVRVPHRVWWVWGLHSDSDQAARSVRLAERTTGGAATTVVAASASLAQSIGRLGYHSQPLVLGDGAISGVDLERFDSVAPEVACASAPTHPGPPSPTVTYLGRLSRAKGLAELVDIWRRVIARVPGAQLLVAGEPDPLDAADRELEALRALRGVRVLGWVDDVPRLLHGTDVLVLPSHREGLPAVVLEAAACRTPAVVWDAVGSRDAVVDHVSGRVIPVGDTSAYAEAVAHLLIDPSLRSAMGDAARTRVVRQYQRIDVEQRFVDYLSGLVNPSIAPGGIDEPWIAPQVPLEKSSRFAGQPV